MVSKGDLTEKLKNIEEKMLDPEFWNNKETAEQTLFQYNELKKDLNKINKRFSGNAILSLYAGAGGDDAEDFTMMLSNMYLNYGKKNNFSFLMLDSQETNNGLRSITYEIVGKNAYGTFLNESGVHRLIRLSPFNVKHTRETSFAMVDVLPVLEKVDFQNIPERDIEFNFSKSSGPGGQNVNKRETAVRLTHIPTGINVHVSSERTQELNRQKAIQILNGKLVSYLEKKEVESLSELSMTSNIENQWGNQKRTYVLHPYKQVKDTETGVESKDPDAVLSGEIDIFIEAGRFL